MDGGEVTEEEKISDRNEETGSEERRSDRPGHGKDAGYER